MISGEDDDDDDDDDDDGDDDDDYDDDNNGKKDDLFLLIEELFGPFLDQAFEILGVKFHSFNQTFHDVFFTGMDVVHDLMKKNKINNHSTW